MQNQGIALTVPKVKKQRQKEQLYTPNNHPINCICKGMAADDGGHLKSRQWITPEMILLTKVQIVDLHLNYTTSGWSVHYCR
jgi:hypothetical protein